MNQLRRLRWREVAGDQLPMTCDPSLVSMRGRSPQIDKPYDLLLKGGHVIDPDQRIDALHDVAFSGGKVSAIAATLNAEQARNVADMNGRLVIPGLIDLHTHVYWGGTALGVDPDPICLESGTTTFVDAGSAGAGNFHGFKRFIIDRSPARILAFLNICYAGIFGLGRGMNVGELQDLRLADPCLAVRVAEEHSHDIVGIKARASLSAGDPGLQPVLLAREAAEKIGKPMMIHVGGPPPLVGQILPLLRPGDILTHAFRGFPNCIVDRNGRLRSEVREAKDRGVLLDIGHGAGAFAFNVAKAVLDQDVLPDVISTDLHVNCINGPVYDLPTTLSKFIALGMDLGDVIRCATLNAARAIGWEDRIGHLRVGALGGATVLSLDHEEISLEDTCGETMIASRVLRHVGTVVGDQYHPADPDAA